MVLILLAHAGKGPYCEAIAACCGKIRGQVHASLSKFLAHWHCFPTLLACPLGADLLRTFIADFAGNG